MSKVVTRRGVLARGMSYSELRHAIGSGRWQPVFPGVFVAHSGRITWRERVEAAVLARGPGAVVSLECALSLWGLTDRTPGIITLAEPWSCHRQRVLPGVRVRRRRRLAAARRHGIPVTSLAQTVLDVTALPRYTLDDVVALVTRVVSAGDLTVADLREELAHHSRHPRRPMLTELFTGALEGLGSLAEARYVRDVEQAHGLPQMERQVTIDDDQARADGRSRSLDFRDPVRRLRLEVDGELFHREKQLADRARDRQGVGEGEATLRAGWIEVTESPCALAADVAVAQLARGWEGWPTACGPECLLPRDPRLRGSA